MRPEAGSGRGRRHRQLRPNCSLRLSGRIRSLAVVQRTALQRYSRPHLAGCRLKASSRNSGIPRTGSIRFRIFHYRSAGPSAGNKAEWRDESHEPVFSFSPSQQPNSVGFDGRCCIAIRPVRCFGMVSRRQATDGQDCRPLPDGAEIRLRWGLLA